MALQGSDSGRTVGNCSTKLESVREAIRSRQLSEDRTPADRPAWRPVVEGAGKAGQGWHPVGVLGSPSAVLSTPVCQPFGPGAGGALRSGYGRHSLSDRYVVYKKLATMAGPGSGLLRAPVRRDFFCLATWPEQEGMGDELGGGHRAPVRSEPDSAAIRRQPESFAAWDRELRGALSEGEAAPAELGSPMPA